MNRNELPSREYLAQFHRAADGAFRVMKAIIPRRDETTIEINEKSILTIRQVDQGGESHVIEFAIDDAETLASEIQDLVRKYRKPFFENGKFSEPNTCREVETVMAPKGTARR